MISSKESLGQFAQVLDFRSDLSGKASGTLPARISRVVLRVLNPNPNTPIYGTTETGEKVGAFGTIALVVDDVIVHQYSLNRFQDTQLLIPQGLFQTVEVFVSPVAACQVAILDEGDRWGFYQVTDPENLPEISSAQLI
jgi:hypothetical protein